MSKLSGQGYVYGAPLYPDNPFWCPEDPEKPDLNYVISIDIQKEVVDGVNNYKVSYLDNKNETHELTTIAGVSDEEIQTIINTASTNAATIATNQSKTYIDEIIGGVLNGQY